MLKAFKYRLYPTEDQRIMLAKTFGCCRYIYNWALGERINAYQEKKETLTYNSQSSLLPQMKKDYPWLKEVYSWAVQNSLKNLNTAYQKFFRDTKNVGKPTFKKRSHRQSFTSNVCKVDFKSGTITIPKMAPIETRFHQEFKGMVRQATISMTPSQKYYVSILVDTGLVIAQKSEITEDTALGIDMGISTLAVCSDGCTFNNPKNLHRSMAKLQLLQKRLSRKQKGSANYEKARLRVARMHEKIANQRRDNLHKITYSLTHDSQVRTICIENLDVKSMEKNHQLAGHICDASFGLFRTMLEYKCDWYGVNLVKIDRYAPSSKTCNNCGHVYDGLTLSERHWICPECGTRHDRDLNAACNIRDIGLKTLPTERGKVKHVDRPTVDDRSCILKSRDGMKQENRRDIVSQKPLSL